MSVAGYGADRAATRADVLGLVRAAVARVLETEETSVDETTPLTREHGVDSLACVEVAELVEQGVSRLVGRPVTVDDDVLASLASVGELVSHLTDRVEGGAR